MCGSLLNLCFLVLVVVFMVFDGVHTSQGLQCQRISVPACQGLGYNMTAMPNLAGHTNQLDAEIRITKLMPILESGCSNRARFLLCSSLFPLCTPDVPRPVTACKSLCETVKAECADQVQLTLIWPEFLNCDTLPQPEKHELCMQIPEEASEKQLLPERPLLPEQEQIFWPWLPWKIPPHHVPKSVSTLICPQNFTALQDDCTPQCNKDAMYDTQQKKITEGLILALSAVCFILTLFSLVTFWAEPTRFGYPERPVLFLCLCYNLYSVCYLERIVFHNSTKMLASGAMLTDEIGGPCALTPPCLASYITTSYLTLCAATWWLIFALCFYLSSHKKWSSEALEKKSGLFHVLAWVPPLAPPISALLRDAVKPNELTGMCSAPGFVEIPALILLILGLFFTQRASCSLKTLQEQIQPIVGLQRFSQIRKRFLIFSLVFFFPTTLAVVASFFERFDFNVPACVSAELCPVPEKTSALPTLLRIFFQLTGGTLTGMWVWSRKTCESYRNRIIATPTPSTSIKSVSSLQKKAFSSPSSAVSNGKAFGPLYSGINFHNVPMYNGQSRV
ncbi:frizzled-3 [Episyrphus balteatus]|uniref:frizzled-3 n=1 Tax=Episyrphus balteatus TaxID=286459 RepID=UPI00248531AE|nr:frizzled-3 [Episyrphus balteatus]XP_055842890.1 frizzled-3 [Episyrphus balteatus]